jgi:hypothetical protein
MNEKNNILIIEVLHDSNLEEINQYLSHNDLKYKYIFIDNFSDLKSGFLLVPLSCKKVLLFEKSKLHDINFIKAPFGCKVLNIYDDRFCPIFYFSLRRNTNYDEVEGFKNNSCLYKLTDLIKDYNNENTKFDKIGCKYTDNNYFKTWKINNEDFYMFSCFD